MDQPKYIRHSTVISARKDKKRDTGRRKNKNKLLKGKEVSVREAAVEGQVVYGEMKFGGTITFIETSQESKAYVISGDDGNQNALLWTYKTSGSSGNAVTLQIVLPASNPAIGISVVGNAITITLKSTAGVSQTTMSQLITAVQADGTLNPLVSIAKMNVNHNGLVLAFPTTAMQYGGGSWLHQIVTVACHEISEITELYLDNRLVTFGASPDPRWGTGIWANKVFMSWEYGTDTQIAQKDLNHQLPLRWTTNHRSQGCGFVYLILIWDANLFAEGHPEIIFKGKGKPVYDTRTSTTGFSKNAALIVADFLNNSRYGFGVSYSDIDTTALNDAADICDAGVPLNGGGTEPQFEINGIFDTSQDRETTLNQLLAAMDGTIVRQGTKWFIYASEYRTPTVTLTEDDLRGTLTVSTHISKSDCFNSVRGTFVSPQADYNETDVPMITNSTYVTEDGLQIFEDMALNFVTSSGQAQRLFKIALERSRQGIIVTFPATIAALQNKVTDVIFLTLPRFGWSAKTFEITDMAYAEEADGTLGVDLELREIASGVFDWSSGEETIVDLSPNSNLPSATDVAEPTNVTLTSGTSELDKRLDGSIFSRLKVAWTASTTEFVITGGHYDIQYKKSAESDWSTATSIPGGNTFHRILDLKDGVSYDVRIRAVNSLNYASDWVTVNGHVVVGKTEPPSDVASLTTRVTDAGIVLTWPKITDIDADRYELRIGASWITGSLIARVRGEGDSYLYTFGALAANLARAEGLSKTSGTHNIRIKAIDTSGNYSTNDTVSILIISDPNVVIGFGTTVIDQNVLLDWDEPLPSTITVNEYDVYKGDTFASAAKIGTVFGTFHTYIEQLGGTFTYWVVSVDLGGNRSTEISAQATVTVPDDFYIQDEQDLEFADLNDKSYVIIGGDTLAPSEPPTSVWGPIGGKHVASMPLLLNRLSLDAGETWDEWFTENGWTSLQDAIDDGFDSWLLPTSNNIGFVEFKIDYGVTFASSFISMTWLEEALQGTVVVTPSISVSADDAIYTEYPGANQLFATNFRYVIYRFELRGTTIDSIVRLYDIHTTISLKIEEETGSITANSGDAGGTTVTFVKDFLDIQDIQVSVNSTTVAIPIYDFTDVPNPTSMKVLVFDANGTRITKPVNYRIRGAVNP